MNLWTYRWLTYITRTEAQNSHSQMAVCCMHEFSIHEQQEGLYTIQIGSVAEM